MCELKGTDLLGSDRAASASLFLHDTAQIVFQAMLHVLLSD